MALSLVPTSHPVPPPYAGRTLPLSALEGYEVSDGARVFAGPRGSMIVFEPMPNSTLARVRYLHEGREAVLPVLGVMAFPEHDFTDDGRWLFVASPSSVQRVDLESFASDTRPETFTQVGRPPAIAVAGNRLVVVTTERIYFHAIDGDAPTHWQTCRWGAYARAFDDRHVVLVGTHEESWLFGVEGDRVQQLHHFRDVFLYDAEAVDEGIITATLPSTRLVGTARPSARLLTGTSEAWTRTFATDDVAVDAAVLAEGRVVFRATAAPPDRTATVDTSRLAYVTVGPNGYGRGVTLSGTPGQWQVWVVTPTAVLPTTLRAGAFDEMVHPVEPTMVLATLGALVSVNLADGTWTPLREGVDRDARVAYFGPDSTHIAVLEREAITGFRVDLTGLTLLWRLTRPAKEQKVPGAVASLAGGKVLAVFAGTTTWVLGVPEGEAPVLLAQTEGIVWTGSNAFDGREYLYREEGGVYEVLNLDRALAAVATMPKEARRGARLVNRWKASAVVRVE